MATLDKIQKNLADVERKLTKSNAIVQKGNSIGYKDAIKLGAKSNSIVSTLKKGIKEYQAFDPTEADAKALLSKMDGIVTLTEQQLGLLVQHKSRFDELKVGGLVKKNVEKSDAVSVELSNIMLAKAPASIKPEAEALNARSEKAFKNARAAFEGATGGEDQADAAADDSD